MKLSEKLDRALAKRRLAQTKPQITQPPKPKTPPKIDTPKIDQHIANYQTVQEGFEHLHQHNLDEDGVGSFTAMELGIEQIQLPMTKDQYVIEDIQRIKTGIIQVQFRKE